MRTVIKRHDSLPPGMTDAPVFVSWKKRDVKGEEALSPSQKLGTMEKGKTPPQVKVGRVRAQRQRSPGVGPPRAPISL